MSKAKKILIHSLTFSPDGVSTAYLFSDIARAFKEKGYEVVVLTTTPHYNLIDEQLAKQPLRWLVYGICKQSDFHGIKVIHVPQKKFRSTLLRLIGFVYWHVISFLVGLFVKNVDVIVSPSPPLTLGLINLWLAKIKRCKVVYNVQEIYPDILGKTSGIVYNVLKRMERKVYNQSDAVTTIDEVFYNTIVDRFVDKSKLHIIPNFVDTELYHPGVSVEGLDKQLFPRNTSLKLLYAGNIGFAQDWEPLLALAERTREEDIEYFVIGKGVTKPYLEERKTALRLDKLHVLPYQARHLMPAILAYSDIQFIFMSKEMEMQGFPSKVYTIMACAKPLLICSGPQTPIVNFLKDYHCAKLVTTDNKEEKVATMAAWLTSVSRDELRLMGLSGMEAIKKGYTKEVVTGRYVGLVDSLLRMKKE